MGTVEPDRRLSLRIHRISPAKRWEPLTRARQALAFATPAAVVLTSLTRRPWLAFPVGAALAVAGVVLVARHRIARRRQAERDAYLDEQGIASFPASDPPAHH